MLRFARFSEFDGAQFRIVLYIVAAILSEYEKRLLLRHGPFDILGGGGAWVFFEKNFLAPILAKKNNLAQWHCEKNNLSPIVTQNSLIGMFEMSKSKNFSGSLRSPE